MTLPPFQTRITYPDPRTRQQRSGVVVGHDGEYVAVRRDGSQPWEPWDRVEAKQVKESEEPPEGVK